MPCFTIRTMNVEFKAEHFGLVEKAIVAMGGRVLSTTGSSLSFRWANGNAVIISNGKIEIRDSDMHYIDQLKQQYSKQAIKQACSRFGWVQKQTSEQKFILTRR